MKTESIRISSDQKIQLLNVKYLTGIPIARLLHDAIEMFLREDGKFLVNQAKRDKRK